MLRAGHSRLFTSILLAGICAGALGLRLWGKDYGLPEAKARPDEELTAARAHVMLARGNLHPVDHAYPGLLKYVNAAALSGYVGYKRLTGEYERLFDFLFDVAVLRPALHYRIARTVTVVFGVATVVAVFFLARVGYDSRNAGLLAAVALAASYLHARDSRFATVDVPMSFFITLALLFAVKAARDFRLRSFALIGLFSGLAAATKYNAGLVAIGALVAAVWPYVAGGDAKKRRFIAPIALRLAVMGTVLLATFVLASPYSLLEYPAVLAKVESMRRLLYEAQGPRSVWAHLRVTFPVGFGWPCVLLGLVGIARAVRHRRAADWAMLAFAVPFFVLVATTRWTFPRYLVPLVPVFAALTGESMRWVLEALPLASRVKPVAAFAAAAWIAFPGVKRTIAFDRIASREDTRVLASAWVSENLPARSVLLVCSGFGAPTINADRRRPPAFEPRLVDCTPDVVRGERFVLTHEHPVLRHYSSVSEDLRAFLERNAREVATFDPFHSDRSRASESREPYYFSGDAFYLPFTGLESVERGGPIVRVWKMEGAVD